MADVGLVATCPNFVIVGQIEIEDQLFGYRTESGSLAEGFAISRVRGVYGPNLESRWVLLKDLFTKSELRQSCQSPSRLEEDVQVACHKALVSKIGIGL